MSLLSLAKNTLKTALASTAIFGPIFLVAEASLETSRSSSSSPGARIEVPILANYENDELSYSDEISLFSKQLKNAYGIDKERSEMFADWILQASTYTGVPEIILASLIMTESTYRTEVVSSVGAVGPGQIRMKYWRDHCPYAEDNPKENVICAGYILSYYQNKYCKNDWSCSLKIYNVGPTNYRNSKEYRAASERYLSKINRYADRFEKELDFYGENYIWEQVTPMIASDNK